MKPSDPSKVFETPTSTYWFEGEILFVIGKKGPELSLEEQKRLTKDFIKKLDGKKICAVMDVTNTSPSSREAREYNAKVIPEIFKAVAFIARNPVGRMLANVYLAFKPFEFAHKVFSNEDDAVKWIRQFTEDK
jgi:hypothetical protein